MSIIPELNDACFVEATEALADIAARFQEEVGRLPTQAEFCELLYWGFRSCSAPLFEDASPGLIEEVKLKIRKSKHKTLTPGDVFAVPTESGKYYIAVFITRNRFGCAYGFFRGARQLRPIDEGDQFEPLGYPIYSGKDEVELGNWPFLGNHPRLLKYFDSEPAILHAKRHHRRSERIGPYGAMETADGELRNLSEEEASRLGLFENDFRPTYAEELLATYLPNREARVAHLGR